MNLKPLTALTLLASHVVTAIVAATVAVAMIGPADLKEGGKPDQEWQFNRDNLSPLARKLLTEILEGATAVREQEREIDQLKAEGKSEEDLRGKLGQLFLARGETERAFGSLALELDAITETNRARLQSEVQELLKSERSRK